MSDNTTTTDEEAPKKTPKKSPAKPAPKKTPKVSAAERAKSAAAKKTRKPKAPKQPTEKQQEAAAAKAAQEEARKEALKELTPKAKEIRTRMEKAETGEQQALNHRVSAAILLAEARETCKTHKIKFEDWCNERLSTENFKFGYEMARKLASAGSSGDPEAVALAIEDMRARNTRNKQKNREENGGDTPKIGHNSGNTTAPGSDGAKKPAKDKFTAAREAVNDLDDKAAGELARDLANQFGDRLIPDAEYKKWMKLKDLGPVELLNYAFGLLDDKGKKKAVEQLADDLGATLEFPE